VHTWLREDGLKLDLLRNHQPWLVPVLGNTFTFGLSHVGSTIIDQMDGRVWYLLEDSELTAMRTIHDAVLRSMPDPDQVTQLSDTEILGARDFMVLFAKPWNRNHEVWFRYRTNEDLRMWLEFLKPLIPAVISRYCRLRGIVFQHG